jgi:hypothetical protein
VEVFTEGVLVAPGRFGWWCGGWSGDRCGVHDSAVGVGEHKPVGVVGVAGDAEFALVMQTVMPRTYARKVCGVGWACSVVGVPVDDVMDV